MGRIEIEQRNKRGLAKIWQSDATQVLKEKKKNSASHPILQQHV